MSRLQRLREKMAVAELPALLITNEKNVTYLSGFTGDESALLVTADQAALITDSRYVAQAKQQVTEFELVMQTKGIFASVAELLAKTDLNSLGFEADQLNYTEYLQLQKVLAKIKLQPTTEMVAQLREIKDAHEIALLKQAIAITDACFDHLLEFVHAGQTELEVAAEMEYFMRKNGASSSSFATIVASGIRSAWPHGIASDKKIAEHELVTFDFGCYYQGYTSDITRTIAVGSVTQELQDIYQLVLDTNQAVVKATKPGVTGGEINQLAHGMIDRAGYGANFGHGTGHGIGLDIHEGPGAWGKYNQQALVSGNVVTDEPGIYLEGLGGVRIEDDLLVTTTGCEVLTQAPKAELLVI
ncbi:M24 family metallopeptidase [Lapidilactobacillus wuchangensis]|uniref:M24 family metallopeptidase n=1 Tax=Lapidilactobacillus wuchangensis TaxID=2486001 RepID=UPI000F76D5FF|nr:Xaa-Pro peptidase family protein [Lapidilactobacillus wuchangensis]